MAKRRLFLCKHAHDWVKDKSNAAIHTPPPWPDPSSLRPHEHQGIQAQSNFLSLTTKQAVLWNIPWRNAELQVSFVNKALRFLRRLRLVQYVFVTHLFCLKLPLPLLSLLGTGCISPRLIRSLLFSHSLSFLLFISSPFHSAADKRFHSRWVCSKQDINFCYSAIHSHSMPPPQLHFNDILCLSCDFSLFPNFLFHFFSPLQFRERYIA